MKTLRETLICSLLAALIACGVFGALLLRNFAIAAAAVPGQLTETRADLVGQVRALRVESLAEIDKQADGLRTELHGDVRLVNAQVSGLRGQLNTALQTVDARTGQAIETVAGIRADLQPVLINSAALVKDAQDSWDDSYDDVRSLVDSAEVATTQTAQTMETINKAVPDQLAAAQKTADSVAGITTDIHAITKATLKPRSFWGKVWAGVTVASRFAGVMETVLARRNFPGYCDVVRDTVTALPHLLSAHSVNVLGPTPDFLPPHPRAIASQFRLSDRSLFRLPSRVDPRRRQHYRL